MTEPQQVAKYLGMMVDMVQGCLTVPTEKKEKILQLLREALELRDACPFRLVQKVAGHLMACRWGFGHISRLMTMSLYHDLNRNDFRSPTVRLSAEAVRDLTFWQGAFDTWDGVRKIWPPFDSPTVFVHIDAAGPDGQLSLGGWGGWTETLKLKLKQYRFLEFAGARATAPYRRRHNCF
jgi:hypothetical protein